MNSKVSKISSPKKPTQELPPYQKRRTVADHVKDNMLCAGKQNYHQRIIFVTHHIQTDKKDRFKEIRKVLNKLVLTKNQVATSDKLTGMMMFCSMYSIYVLEGGEDNIGIFMQSLNDIANDLFDVSRVVLIYNNSNRRFFEKMFYAYATPNETFPSESLSYHDILENIINKLTNICLQVAENPSIIDDTSQIKLKDMDLLPQTEMIDKILKITSLQTIEKFAKIYGCVPEFFDYETNVWPHPYDYFPDNVFDWGKFDVNLTR